MKTKYYFKISFNNFIHKKINIINVILLVLSMTLFISVMSFSKTFTNILYKESEGNIKHRLLLVNKLEEAFDRNDFKDIPHLEFISSSSEYNHYVSVDGNSISLIGVPNKYISTIYGTNDFNDSHSLICPSRFYFGEDPEEYNHEFMKNIKEGKDYLNRTLSINSINYQEEYQVVGIYDVSNYSFGEYNVCFTSQSNIKEIHTKEEEYYKQECEKDSFSCVDSTDNNGGVVLVDQLDNIESVTEAIESKGYYTSVVMEYNTEGIKTLNEILLTISIIVMIITFIVLAVSSNKFIQYNKKNNLIYKALGYSNKVLIKINYLDNIIRSIISFLITILLIILLYVLIMNIFSAHIKLGYSIDISYSSIFVGFLAMLGISLLSCYISLRNNGNCIIEELVDEEA